MQGMDRNAYVIVVFIIYNYYCKGIDGSGLLLLLVFITDGSEESRAADIP